MPLIPSKKSRIEEDPWEQETIHITIVKDNGQEIHRDVEAFVYGSLAVHEGICIAYGDQQVITHVPTGTVVINVKTERDAKRIGEVLWTSACLAFREQTTEAVKAKLPEWVVRWLKLCRQLGQYRDPSSFRKNAKR